ncbi:MAG: aminopeptidase [Gemmatimonadetes bacterium]|nr:aminopeptidase [Gemmatimonadota bacterium]
MRRLSLILVVIPAIAAAQPRMSPADSLARAIDRVFDGWRDTEGPGCAVGVSRNGRSVYERGYGMANLETATPIRPSSIFHVASVSKQFTAAAIMLLARDGKLSVDDDIRKYLPEMPSYGTPITIRHLLTHTSGLRDQWSLLALARGRFEEDRITEADVMDIVPRQTALNFKPGAEYVYSNTGFTLLAVIVKRVSGQSLREFADQRIFKPLGMTSTHFHDDYTMLVPGRTSAYEPRDGALGWRVGIPNFDVYGATSLFTTVGDLLKWEANLDKPVVGDAEMVSRMQMPTPLTTGDTSNYGFGLTMSRYRGARVVEHNGADAGYRSYVGRFPELGVGIAIECNGATANTTALARGVADAVLRGELGPAQAEVMPQATATVSAELLARRAGVYVQPTTLQIVELSVRNGALIMGRQAGPALVPVSENRFRMPGQPVELVFANGEHAGFDRAAPGVKPVTYEWRQSVAPTKAVLSAFAGRYVSDELGGAIYRVTATDSTIELATGTSTPFPARPVFANTFLGAGYTIQFSEAKSRVTGFEITDSRMRRVKFVRMP